jgi:hypothetical protein
MKEDELVRPFRIDRTRAVTTRVDRPEAGKPGQYEEKRRRR